MNVHQARTALAKAQKRERDLNEAIASTEFDLSNARAEESAAAIDALDSGDQKRITKVQKAIRDFEDELRVKRLQSSALAQRTREATNALNEALAAEQREQAEGMYAEFVRLEGKMNAAILEAADAVRSVVEQREAIASTYRAAVPIGQRVVTGEQFAERLTQAVVNALGAHARIGERSSATKPLADLVAPMVSAIGFDRSAA